ncbi:MAG: hypothetical protein ACM32O_12390, partial [Clostridia bacterium]
MLKDTPYSRKASLSLHITEFEMPPMQDLLIIGKKAPIGPEAVRRMAEALSPEQFEIIRIHHPKIEALLVKKTLLKMLDQETLLQIALEETESIFNEYMVLRSEV